MHSVTVSAHFRFSVDRAWQLVGDPNSLAEWHPGISKLVPDGDVRVCTLADGAVVRERIEVVDAQQRMYRYRIVESPFPFTDYVSTLSVREAPDGGSVIEWSSSFEVPEAPPADICKVVRDVYSAGFDSLRGRS